MVQSPEDILLGIDNLSVSYGNVKALRNVSLKVKEREIVVLIGANGAGKSTILQTVLGINRADNGRISFSGRLITNLPADKIVRAGIFLVPEGRGVFSAMSVLDNLLLGAHHNMDDMDANLARVFEWFPILSDRKIQIAGTLSGGERQMLSIGRALMSTPKLIMIDEPSLGLAPMMVKAIFEIMVNLNKENYTILLSEQNAWKALNCAHRGYVLETGSVVMYGGAKDLLDDPRVRQAYLGA